MNPDMNTNPSNQDDNEGSKTTPDSPQPTSNMHVINPSEQPESNTDQAPMAPLPHQPFVASEIYPSQSALQPSQATAYQQPPQQQQFQPAAPQPPAREPLNAGLIILQWLTYAFWGWTLLALSVLTGLVVSNFINGSDVGSFTPYGIAAVLVLLPISFVCDTFYSKKEPQKKAGAEMLVMVIHAVIFALFGIGSLIFAVFSLVQMFTSSSDNSGAVTTLVSSLIIATYYGITFMRTLNPASLPWIVKSFKMFMLVSVGIITILGIIGPVMSERSTRDDKLITSGISGVERAIDNYARTNNKLPSDLAALSLSGDSEKLVAKNLVTYKPEGVLSSAVSTSRLRSSTTTSRTILSESPTVYKYQLCVTFKKETKNFNDNNYSSYERGGYSTYVSAYSHAAGETCYKLKTSNY